MRHLLILPLAAVCIASCANDPRNRSNESSAIAGDTIPLTGSSRKLAQHAQFKCQVKNVLETTGEIEQLVTAAGGIIVESKLDNQPAQQKTLYYKTDSLKQVWVFAPRANLTLRVPAIYLDTIVRMLPSMTTFIESRNLVQDDYTFTYMANRLRNEALSKAAGSNASIDTSSKGEMALNRRIENLAITDKVNYADLSIELTQPEQVYTIITANPQQTLQEPVTIRFYNGIVQGWQFILGLCVALVTIWPLWLIVILCIYIYRLSKSPSKSPLKGRL